MRNRSDALPVATDLSRTLALFSDPLRLRLFLLLAAGRTPELCVTEVAEVLSSSISNTSHQLHKLALAGIVEPYRKGRMVCYRFRRTPLTMTLYRFLRALDRVKISNL